MIAKLRVRSLPIAILSLIFFGSFFVNIQELKAQNLNMDLGATISFNELFVEFIIANNETEAIRCDFIRVKALYSRQNGLNFGWRQVSLQNIIIAAGTTFKFEEGGKEIIQEFQFQDPTASISAIETDLETSCSLYYPPHEIIDQTMVSQMLEEALLQGGHSGQGLGRTQRIPAPTKLRRFYVPNCENDSIFIARKALNRLAWALKCRYITLHQAEQLAFERDQLREELRYPVFGEAGPDENGIWEIRRFDSAPDYLGRSCELDQSIAVIGYCKLQ